MYYVCILYKVYIATDYDYTIILYRPVTATLVKSYIINDSVCIFMLLS